MEVIQILRGNASCMLEGRAENSRVDLMAVDNSSFFRRQAELNKSESQYMPFL